MCGFAVPLRQRLHHGLDANMVGSRFMMGEREPKEFVTEYVTSASLLIGKSEAAERGQSPMRCRFGAVHRLRHLFETDALGVLGEFDQHGEHTVRSDEFGLHHVASTSFPVIPT